jgi:hypothetical protein
MATPLEPPHGLASTFNCAQSLITRYGLPPGLTPVLTPVFTGCTLSVWTVPPRCCAWTQSTVIHAVNPNLAIADIDISTLLRESTTHFQL